MSKKIGGRRRDREAEVPVAGQERSLKRRRNRQDDIVLSAGIVLSMTYLENYSILHGTGGQSSYQRPFQSSSSKPFQQDLDHH